MGIEAGLKFGALGFIADRLLGTGNLATLAAGLWGGFMQPDAGEMSTAYDRRRATLNDTLRNFGGFEMPEGLFGNSNNRSQESLRPNQGRAEAEATRREKSDGINWKKLLIGGGAALLGINLLDNIVSGPFSNGLFAPFGAFPGGGIFSNLLSGLVGGFGNPYAHGNPMMNLAYNPLSTLLAGNPFGILC